MKICSKCGQYKPLSDFYKDSSKKDGFKYACKVCCDSSRDRSTKEYKDSAIIWHKSEAQKESEKRKISELQDSYVKKRLRLQYGLTTEEINGSPQLIELKRIELKNKRYGRQFKTNKQ